MAKLKGNRKTKQKRTYNTTARKKKVFLELLLKNAGNISLACKKADIARSTYYEWLDNDEEFANAVQDKEEELIDFAESQAFKLLAGYQKVTNTETYDRKSGQVVNLKKVEHIGPDPAITKFLLERRRPEKYKNTQDINLNPDQQLDEIAKGKIKNLSSEEQIKLITLIEKLNG